MAAVVPVVVLDLLDAADGAFAERAVAALQDLHDLATAAPDVTPPDGSETRPNGRQPPASGWHEAVGTATVAPASGRIRRVPSVTAP